MNAPQQQQTNTHDDPSNGAPNVGRCDCGAPLAHRAGETCCPVCDAPTFDSWIAELRHWALEEHGEQPAPLEPTPHGDECKAQRQLESLMAGRCPLCQAPLLNVDSSLQHGLRWACVGACNP